MLTFHINGVSVTAPSEARAVQAFREVTGYTEPFLLITSAQRPEPDSTVAAVLRRDASQPMGFAISPMTGRMTAVS